MNVNGFRLKDSRGSALLFTLLIVFAILSASLTVSAIVLSQTKQTRNSVESIIAAYAAESGLEQGIYYVRKIDRSLSSSFSVFFNHQHFLENTASWKLDQEEKTELVRALKSQQTLQLDLADRNDLNTSAGIETVTLDWTGNATIQVSLLEWPSANAVSWDSALVEDENRGVNFSKQYVDSTGSLTITALQNDHHNMMRIRSIKGDAQELTVRLYASDSPAPQNLLPIPNYVVLKSTGSFGRVTQAMSSEFPLFLASSGVFDYVLFSGGDILKIISQ